MLNGYLVTDRSYQHEIQGGFNASDSHQIFTTYSLKFRLILKPDISLHTVLITHFSLLACVLYSWVESCGNPQPWSQSCSSLHNWEFDQGLSALSPVRMWLWICSIRRDGGRLRWLLGAVPTCQDRPVKRNVYCTNTDDVHSMIGFTVRSSGFIHFD